MKRKDFIRNAAGIACLGIGLGGTSFPSETKKSIEKIRPKRIKPGDTIGLAAPSTWLSEKELESSVEKLNKLGFNVVYYDKILSRTGYLAGDDKTRAEGLNEMFARKDVDAIMCARGGYGCQRILDYVDFELIKQNPKIFIGFSDITALLYAIFSQTGLICFHGLVSISTFDDYSTKKFRNVLMEPEENKNLTDREDILETIWTINKGSAIGELVGGNLSIVSTMIGTKYDVNYDGKIVFLEEVGEEPYRVDRMFTHLINSGKLENAKGLALGIFSNCEVREVDPGFKESFKLSEVILDRVKDLNIPAVYGLPFGHVSRKTIIPFGAEAKLDSTNGTLELLEAAVK